MIHALKLQNTATYTDPNGITLPDLKKVNFLFGANASGKTTIGRLINNSTSFPDCEVNWANGRLLPTCVYNQDFVRANILESNLEGIFTVGAEAVERETTIATKRAELDQVTVLNTEAQQALSSKKEELRTLAEAFKDHCWEHRKRFESAHGLSEAFRGVRADKNRLFDRLQQKSGVSIEGYDLAELRKKGETIYGEEKDKIQPLELLSLRNVESLENTGLLAKPIVGKEDVEIGALIRQLNIDDWVSRGVKHLQHSDDQCPFCQQDVKAVNLKARLEAFFDDSYARGKQALQKHKANWEREINRLQSTLSSLVEGQNAYLPQELLAAREGEFKALAESVLRALRLKLDRPGKEFTAESLLPVLKILNELIAAANKEIVEHNTTIDNITEQRAELEKQVWAYFCGTLRPEQTKFEGNRQAAQTYISEKQQEAARTQSNIVELKRAIETLESQQSATGEAIQNINAQLARFGFVTFRLRESTNRSGFYQIVRADGSPANATLSEAEKTFIAFLYFCESLKGGTATVSRTAPKVVVFDDPVSSLDGNILSIVSTLIREFIAETIAGSSAVKQIFLLTHNVYFHKEVTYRYSRGNYSFWMVRRSGNVSTVDRHADNPVRSSYELLWQEYMRTNSMSRQNTMRRILEHYFKIMGDLNIKNAIEQFPVENRAVCKSLFSWVNDGSHSVMDDLYVAPDEELNRKYEEVFKEIFVQLNHEAHYNMMRDRFTENT